MRALKTRPPHPPPPLPARSPRPCQDTYEWLTTLTDADKAKYTYSKCCFEGQIQKDACWQDDDDVLVPSPFALLAACAAPRRCAPPPPPAARTLHAHDTHIAQLRLCYARRQPKARLRPHAPGAPPFRHGMKNSAATFPSLASLARSKPVPSSLRPRPGAKRNVRRKAQPATQGI